MPTYEERYWELREACERAFDIWMENPRKEENHQKYWATLSEYQDFCMDVLEQLMDKNPDVLAQLKTM